MPTPRSNKRRTLSQGPQGSRQRGSQSDVRAPSASISGQAARNTTGVTGSSHPMGGMTKGEAFVYLNERFRRDHVSQEASRKYGSAHLLYKLVLSGGWLGEIIVRIADRTGIYDLLIFCILFVPSWMTLRTLDGAVTIILARIFDFSIPHQHKSQSRLPLLHMLRLICSQSKEIPYTQETSRDLLAHLHICHSRGIGLLLPHATRTLHRDCLPQDHAHDHCMDG